MSLFVKNSIPQHNWSQFGGQQLKWTGSDSLDHWQKNMSDPDRRKVLEKYGWDEPGAISYQLNRHGFRCNEFDNTPSIVTLGCSFTAGVGLPHDDIWPVKLSNELGINCWNLGVPGSAMDTCFRLLDYYIQKLNIKMVCLLRPDASRFEWVQHAGNIECVTPSSGGHDSVQQIWYQHDMNSQLNYLKNTMAIQYLCQCNNIKLIIKDLYFDLFNTPPRDPYPSARDLCHVGTVEHIECARQFLLDS
jgi:hypothetical protein